MRDRRLDLWRGLCLIDMILVHLVHEGVQFGALTPWIVDYTRFAAGGFVFVAGLGVGLAYLRPRGGDHPLGTSTARLWTRAVYLLGVHYALTGIIVTLDVLRGARQPAADPLALVLDIAFLREAPPYIDVLPLYVAMLLVTPAAFALLRRGLWPLVALVSAAVFAYGRHDPGAFSPRASVEFPFLLWQAFFVAGLVFSVAVPRLDRGRRAWRAAMAGAWIAFVVTTTLAYGPRFDLVPEPTLVSFAKVPLTTGELLRYLTATLVVLTTSAVAWRRVRGWASAAAIATLGRRSLAVYGAHVFLQMLALLAVTPLWWIGSAQALVVVPVLAGSWLVARAVDRWEARARPWSDFRRAFRTWGAAPAGLVAAALLIVVVRPPLPDEAGVEVGSETQFSGEIDLVDVVDEPSFTPDVTIDEAPFDDDDDAPEIEELDELDDAPLQSGLGGSLVV